MVSAADVQETQVQKTAPSQSRTAIVTARHFCAFLWKRRSRTAAIQSPPTSTAAAKGRPEFSQEMKEWRMDDRSRGEERDRGREGEREGEREGRSHIYQGTPTDWARTSAVSALRSDSVKLSPASQLHCSYWPYTQFWGIRATSLCSLQNTPLLLTWFF